MISTMHAAGPGPVPLGLLCNRHGDGSGTRLLVLGGLQGDDISSVLTLGSIHKFLLEKTEALPEGLQGRIDLYPVIHPHGVDALGFASRGESALTAPVLQRLESELSEVDLLIHIRGYAPGTSGVTQLHHAADLPESLQAQLKHAQIDVVRALSAWMPGTLAAGLANLGIPVLELWVGEALLESDGPSSPLMLVDQLLSDGGFYGDGTSLPTDYPQAQVIDAEQGITALNAAQTGLFQRAAGLCDDIWPDQVIGTITEIGTGRVLERLRAPEHCRLLSWREPGMIRPGEWVVKLIPF